MNIYNELKTNYKIDLDKVLDNFIIDQDDIIYISGSFAEDFNNQGSDLDIYIITKKSINSSLFNKDKFYTQNFDYGIEVTLIGEPILISVFYISNEELSKLLTNVQFYINHKKINIINKRKLEFYHRVIKGIPIQNEDLFSELISEEEIKKFNLALFNNGIKYSENRHEDAIGALKSNDDWTAFLSSQISLNKAVESLLYLYGETNPSDKWLFRRLFKHFDRETQWVDSYLNICEGDFKSKQLKEKTIEIITLSRTIRMYGLEQKKMLVDKGDYKNDYYS